jgi:hypothetical protein
MSQRAATVLLALALAAILIGSFMPWQLKYSLGTEMIHARIPGTALHFNPHRTLHFSAFAVLAVLAFAVRPGGVMKIAGMSFLMAVLSVSTEVAESRQGHSLMEWTDVRDDLLGVLLAILITLAMRLRSGTASPAASEK